MPVEELTVPVEEPSAIVRSTAAAPPFPLVQPVNAPDLATARGDRTDPVSSFRAIATDDAAVSVMVNRVPLRTDAT